nr:MAG TPA: hypothetical protein [Crassvirales sp.]
MKLRYTSKALMFPSFSSLVSAELSLVASLL